MVRKDGRGAWNERFLPRLTTSQIQKLPKEKTLIVLPVGAVEQHGPHLPVFTDTLLAETVLDVTCRYLPEDSSIWFLPPLPYGKSNEHCGRPGTFSLSSSTLQAVIMDLSKSVKQSGFQRLLLFTTHGGNHDLLNLMAREVRLETGLLVFRLNIGGLTIDPDLLSEKEKKFGIHGGDYETSLVMASYPEWVQEERLTAEFPQELEEETYLQFQNGTFAWTIDDVSSSGILGDAQRASAAKGRKIYAQHGKLLASILMDMVRFEFKKRPDIENERR